MSKLVRTSVSAAGRTRKEYWLLWCHIKLCRKLLALLTWGRGTAPGIGGGKKLPSVHATFVLVTVTPLLPHKLCSWHHRLHADTEVEHMC